MLALQTPPSSSSFPRLPPAALSFRRRTSMTVSPSTHSTPTTVFHALGSYADRIKDANGKLTTAHTSSSPKSTPTTMPSSSSSSSGRNQKQANANKGENKADTTRTDAPVEDGPWETVQSTRQRSRPEEKKSSANTSRNWRERPLKESKDKEEDEGKKPGPKSQKKAAASGPSSSSAAPPKAPAAPSASSSKADKAAATSNVKPAWGKAAPAVAEADIKNMPAAAPQASKQPAAPSKAENASSKSGERAASVASPVPSAETASSVTAASSGSSGSKTEVEDEGSWRTRSKDSAPEAIAAPAPAPTPAPVPRPAAPVPSVNPWELRKKTIVAPLANGLASATTANGSSSAAHSSPLAPRSTNAEAKVDDLSQVVPKKKKKNVGPLAPAVVADPSMWPDVAQAAEVVKKDEKKDRSKDAESPAQGEDSGIGGKKMKWKSIPAAELQAAADRQAEHDRKVAAAKKRVVKPEPAGPVAPLPVKAKARKGSMEKPKVPSAPATEMKLPPIPAKASLAAPFTPSYMTAPAAANTSQTEATHVVSNGEMSTSMSRTGSKQSQQSHQSLYSPVRPSSPLPSSGQLPTGENASGRSVSGSIPASGAQNGFANVNGIHPIPRPPRGRDSRGSFTHRGRGGYRGMKGLVSPIMGPNGLPIENGRAQGQHYYPTNAMGMSQYGGQTVYDPIQAQYALFQRGMAPPPPMPQTVVPNIDPQRFYILGQVEYYFSMQNLAMDFFLRQQMDTEGWIDISMIASFNRLRSLTPEVPVVTEVMLLSSLLEVRDTKVRIAGAESKRWVLPDAKLSVFPPDPPSSEADSPAMMSQKESEISDIALETLGSLNGIAGLGMEDMNGQSIQMPKYLPGDVENALMKSVPPSSSTSVLNGDGDGVSETPATSMSGREGDDDEAESVKADAR